MARLELPARPGEPRWLFAACLGWAALVVLYYYRQLFHIAALGPLGWLRDQWSLKLFVLDLHALAGIGRSFLFGSLAQAFPAFEEAVRRAGSGLLAAVLVILAAFFVGRLAMRLLGHRPGGRLEALLFTLSTGFGGLAYCYLLLACLGFYRPSVVASLAVLLAVAELITQLCRRGAAARNVDLVPKPCPRQSLLRPGDRPWFAVVLVGTAVVFVTALAPETEFDALMYHLYLPRLWLEAGPPVDLITERTSLYPLTWEMLNGPALVFGGAVVARLLQTTCFVLLILAVVAWTRSAGEKASSWLAAALFASTPSMLAGLADQCPLQCAMARGHRRGARVRLPHAHLAVIRRVGVRQCSPPAGREGVDV